MMAASNSMRSADAFDTRTWKQDAWVASIQGWVETKHAGAFWWPFWRVTITRDYIVTPWFEQLPECDRWRLFRRVTDSH